MRILIPLAVLSSSLFACGARSLGPTQPLGTREVIGAAEPAATSHSEPVMESPEIDLDTVAGELPPAAPERLPHPLAELSDAEVEALVLGDASELGTASLGRPNRGSLFGAVQMPAGEGWRVVNPRETWGTQETIDYLSHSIKRVGEMFPGTPDIHIGDISKESGGHLRPHHSHQAGRDVDLGFYYLDGSAWYSKANIKNLDVARTWALLKVTVTETDVQAVFLDHSLQRVLRAHATKIGESEQWLDQVFGGPTSDLRPLVLHEPGHKTHLHIRYYNPIAQETGRRVYKALLKHKKISPPSYFQKYKARRGDSLNRIAKKNKTTVQALLQANGLKSNRIYAGRTYRIPRRGGVEQTPRKLVLPARRIPTHVALAPVSPKSEQPQLGASSEVAPSARAD